MSNYLEGNMIKKRKYIQKRGPSLPSLLPIPRLRPEVFLCGPRPFHAQYMLCHLDCGEVILFEGAFFAAQSAPGPVEGGDFAEVCDAGVHSGHIKLLPFIPFCVIAFHLVGLGADPSPGDHKAVPAPVLPLGELIEL